MMLFGIHDFSVMVGALETASLCLALRTRGLLQLLSIVGCLLGEYNLFIQGLFHQLDIFMQHLDMI